MQKILENVTTLRAGTGSVQLRPPSNDRACRLEIGCPFFGLLRAEGAGRGWRACEQACVRVDKCVRAPYGQ